MSAALIGRQVGKHFQGAVYRGSTRALGASPVRASASIPSKFETVINVGTKEKDGFGVRSHRFAGYETELPGPGNYTVTGDMTYKHDSISKKGYGSFPSKNKRFHSKKVFTAPGPGAYDQKRWDGKTERRDFSRAKYGSIYADRHASSAPLAEAKQMHVEPGPGAYQPRAEVQPAHHGGRSSFASTFDRFNDKFVGVVPMPDGARPAPGQYDTARSTLRQQGVTSGFKSGTVRNGLGGAAPARFGAPSVIYGEDAVSGPSEPGPGSHHSTYLDMENKFKHAPKVYSAFGKTGLDRFGRPVEPKARRSEIPGPGAYTLAAPDDVRQLTGASSAFVSASSRLQHEAANNLGIANKPGHTFYSQESAVKSIDKKNFNLNARKLWI